MASYNTEQARQVWFIADTHFDHKNIIRYCQRPFTNIAQMNQVLVSNWNITVGVHDLVYFLGDMCFGRRHRKACYWLNQLNGRKIFIRGSHDRRAEITGDSIIKVSDLEIIKANKVPFLLVHDPFNLAVMGWTGWIIHGHSHNHGPFLDGKRINVSVEHIGYKPISLYEILQIITNVEAKTQTLSPI